ncbi:MAG: hypothetical protein NTY90_05395 [Candidatus Micrarchaeota archaeon]|nr:hypothetical protein [Candidatus Micrarchaeota archaeon]
MLPLLLLGELGQMLGDISFVIQIMVFSYILFWLYMTFRDIPVLFGLATVVAAYFMFIQPIPVILLVIVFFAVFLFGNQMQMLIMFGLEPILGIFGVGKYAAQYEYEYVGELQNKLAAGKELAPKEMEELQRHQQKQETTQMQSQYAQETMRRRTVR